MNTLKKKMNKKGFTLAELLIVVAIIAVLVAISIPIFTTQLEKSREAVDAANIRAAYAEVAAAALTDSATTNDYFKEIEMKQRKQAWSNGANDFAPEILAPGATSSTGATFQSTLPSETTIATGADDATCAVVYHHGTATTAAYFTIEHTTPTAATGVIDVDTLN
ncbi:MAG: prepilin-type N-terminal cleavage/methylation domain-containing protein [Eubacteriales bacterium]|nr:prepilin-type N-terminal cleavage/methylation domain-containing protein [Eubacteriales bacterium]